MISLINANTLRIPLADSSVSMIATSPPFYALRDYQVSGQIGLENLHDCLAWARNEPPCDKCYVCAMRLVAKELWRVLHPTGTLWLNLGDSYSGSGKARGSGGIGPTSGKQLSNRGAYFDNQTPVNFSGLKPKDLCMIPARVALALQADGWTLRSDIIWNKPNPMPESMTDRPTKAHEYIFLLAKQKRYYYDAEAIQEPQAESTGPRQLRAVSDNHKNINGAPGQPPHSLAQPRPNRNSGGGYSQKTNAALREAISGGKTSERVDMGYRNKRTVWTVPTHSYGGAHFATWPEALVDIMIRVGTSEKGVCRECGKQWIRVIDHTPASGGQKPGYLANTGMRNDGERAGSFIGMIFQTLGWQPSCSCNAPLVPATILDPFAGSGTTGVVAQRLGRSFIGLDLSYSYLNEQAKQHIADALRDTGETHTIDTDNGKLTQPSIFATMDI